MNSRELLNSPRTSLASAVLAPGLLLLAARFLAGGPQPSPAATSLAPAPSFPMAATGPAVKPPLPPATAKALTWIADKDLGHPRPWRSPMESPPEPPKAETTAAQHDEPTKPTPTAPAADPIDSVKISAIMGAGRTGLVSHNGAFLRLGDEIAPGWHIDTIDGKNRLIIVSHEGKPNRTLRLTP